MLVRFCVVIGRGLSVAVYRFFLKATLEIGAGISGGVPREFKGLLGHSLNPDPPAASGTLKYDVRDAGHFPWGSRPFHAWRTPLTTSQKIATSMTATIK